MALVAPDIEVVGITAAAGNVSLEQASKNTRSEPSKPPESESAVDVLVRHIESNPGIVPVTLGPLWAGAGEGSAMNHKKTPHVLRGEYPARGMRGDAPATSAGRAVSKDGHDQLRISRRGAEQCRLRPCCPRCRRALPYRRRKRTRRWLPCRRVQPRGIRSCRGSA